MMPPAPGLCSSTKGWPRLALSLPATTRARRSAVPAAENGTTIFTGRLGQGLVEGLGEALVAGTWATAGVTPAQHSNNAAACTIRPAIMGPPPGGLLWDRSPA